MLQRFAPILARLEPIQQRDLKLVWTVIQAITAE
jgi:hypothetical protein